MRIEPIPPVYPPSKPTRERPKPSPKPKPKRSVACQQIQNNDSGIFEYLCHTNLLTQGQGLSGLIGTIARSVVLIVMLSSCGGEVNKSGRSENETPAVKYYEEVICSDASTRFMNLEILGFEYRQRSVDNRLVEVECSVINSLGNKKTQRTTLEQCDVSYIGLVFSFSQSVDGWHVVQDKDDVLFDWNTCETQVGSL